MPDNFERCMKSIKKHVSISKTIFSETSYGHVEVSFDNSAGKFLPGERKVFHQCQEKMKKNGNFRKTLNFVKFFLQTLKMLPSHPYRKRFNKRSNHFVQKVNFLKKKLLISKVNILFWEFSKGHLECCSKNLPKKNWPEGRKKFSECPSRFCKEKSSKCCYGHVECSFDTPAANILTKSRLLSDRCPKMIQKV